MWELGWMLCDADPDPLMKPDFRSEVKWECCSYILWYEGEIICTHYDQDDVLVKLNCYVPVKPSSVNKSDVYLVQS